MEKGRQIRLMVVDDHPVVREGLAAIVSTQPDISVIAETGSGESAIKLFRKHHPDVVLMDLELPGAFSGIEATAAICKEFPNAKILLLTVHSGDEDIHRALGAGARGYLLKESLRDQLLEAIRAIHSGKRYVPPSVAVRLADRFPGTELTRREIEVLQRIAKGESNKEIAAAFEITEATIKGHVTNILAKLGVSDRTGAVVTALKRGIIHLD